MLTKVMGFSKATCVICDRESECFDAEFQKLKGEFCSSCFKRLLRAKSGKKEQKLEVKPPAGEAASR